MVNFPTNSHGARAGVSLLEVLITIFVLSVGLLSVFGLFMAGRELEARALVLEQADTFAKGQGTTLAMQWLRASQWQRYERGAGFRWLFRDGSGDSTTAIKLPIIIDPWGLASDTFVGGARTGDWDWDTFLPVQLGASDPLPFTRITLPAAEQSPRDNDFVPDKLPLTRDQAINLFADPDSIEYDSDLDPNNPPKNAFELGRRRRGSDLTAALFLSKRDDGTQDYSISIGKKVEASLLIFYKPVPGYEIIENSPTKWPAGFIQLGIDSLQSNMIAATVPPARKPQPDLTALRRALRPGKWALVVREKGPTGGPFNYDTCWSKMISVSNSDGNGDSWLIVLDGDLPTDVTALPGTPVNTYYLLVSETLVLRRPLGSWDLIE